MADCDDPSTRERFSFALIPIGCAVMDFLRRMRRPGATVTAFLVVALFIVSLAKEREAHDPTWWTRGSVGQAVFFVLSALTSLGSLFVALGFRRALTRQNSTAQFQTAAESLRRLVRDKTSLQEHEIGVNIWLAKGMKGFRQLVREATATEPRNPTPITWTKGKGIIGEAWARNTTRFADLDAVRETNPTEEAWCSLAREERFRLTWAEFNETSRYRAVLAVPLRRRRFGRYWVRGVAAVDALVPGKADELRALESVPEFYLVRLTCEAAFAGDPRRA